MILKIVVALCFLATSLRAQQVSIPRIDQMPDSPSPYQMRNWKQVARGYDTLVFNTSLAGQYLPLTELFLSGINYPAEPGFGIQSYVGSQIGRGEAINCIPAVVGATLVGLDKSSQGGRNWVLMCQDWFNKKNGEQVYLNSPGSQTGDDWWYETMPNVFFYELASLYPGAGDFPNQVMTVADRWLQAIKAMGGSTTPWGIANIQHRAFALATMSPNNSGVPEPEAAGAIAWILYCAYVETGKVEYRIGAELALESLMVYPTNPSYELQLPYGTFIAARMNAELGTAYDISKLLNWCFSNGNGTLRQWGAIVGTWGGNDCSGLIGEASTSNDYAFFMNAAEQLGALVPLVRYDDRYARAIGKWALNTANAARLFYTNYMPDDHQDSQQWAHQYDPESYIAHEALRQFKPSNAAISPYATGDAIGGGWAPTNLGLYGSSHVGILGGIIDTTNIEKILKLDLLRTDYFHRSAYPSFLYYNPYAETKTVEIATGPGQHDVYDAVNKTFLQSGISGVTTITIPPDGAVIAVLTPSGGTLTYDLDRTLVDGVVADYRSGRSVVNYPPRIKSLSPDTSVVILRNSIRVYCAAADRDGDSLRFHWSATRGFITDNDAIVTWTAPDSAVVTSITCIVTDGRGGGDTANVVLTASPSPNHAPVILRLGASPRKIDLHSTSSIHCTATDLDGDSLAYTWTGNGGTLTGNGPSRTFTAAGIAGNSFIRCTVDDGHGASVTDSIGIEIRDFSLGQTGNLIAYYPFSGNANDASGNSNNGTVNGATLVADRNGRANSAYFFDGASSFIQIPNSASLNFQNAISINFWMKVGTFYDREAYPLSHGNWQNRWKISITNGGIRWTVKTDHGVKDLDSESKLVLDSVYNVTVIYSGSDFEIYLNGDLDAFDTWSGFILPTTIDLTVGKVLPTDNNYNFRGVLDDIRIYNYALSMHEIAALAEIATSVRGSPQHAIPEHYVLGQNYPNPFNPSTTIRYGLPRASRVSLILYNTIGQAVVRLVDADEDAGFHEIRLDAAGFASGVYFYRMLAHPVEGAAGAAFGQTRKCLFLR